MKTQNQFLKRLRNEHEKSNVPLIIAVYETGQKRPNRYRKILENGMIHYRIYRGLQGFKTSCFLYYVDNFEYPKDILSESITAMFSYDARRIIFGGRCTYVVRRGTRKLFTFKNMGV